jgi:LPXTG-motif cell wall-anchored protein
MEEPNMNRTTTVQMGALDPSIFRTRVRAPVTPINIVPRVGTQDIRGYPTIQEEDEPDWTTYAMIGGLVLVVGGGIYLAKKRKIF